MSKLASSLPSNFSCLFLAVKVVWSNCFIGMKPQRHLDIKHKTTLPVLQEFKQQKFIHFNDWFRSIKKCIFYIFFRPSRVWVSHPKSLIWSGKLLKSIANSCLQNQASQVNKFTWSDFTGFFQASFSRFT